ncbi:SDR family oxidoreductase [Pseudonocardia halophobica]|uniref:SDR family oxidoreductase n=1 Tax=Pseudonocardia halophobica TaxID=29401 RepID=UPI003D8C8F8C
MTFLAVELAPLGVRANTVSASTSNTEALRSVLTHEEAEERLARAAALNSSGRRVEIDEVVDAVEFVCSDRATMMQGQRLTMDGGFHLR